ncbi:MAG: electron transport complex subunit RsxC [Alteromonadaceae bacterium]|nr:MAG: electron transport complex subunit RsxC [Alteromonadaceae bacterium]
MRKIWDIPGGVHPPENKAQSNHRPIAQVALPKQVILPLNQHIGAAAIPCVSVGERVLKGQVIATAQGLISAPLHASTSGTVSAIESRLIPHPSGMSADCIIIDCDGQDTWVPLKPCEDPLAEDKKALIEKIRNAGIAGMGGAGFPCAVKLSPRANSPIDTLILNGTECEPYITADDMLMRERAEEIIQGAQVLAHLLGQPKEILVGIEDNKPEAIAAMQSAAEGTPISIVGFPTKYPSGGEKQLIYILTGKEVPSKALPASVGVVLQNVGTALAAWRAVRYGEPLVSRVTTVVGESLSVQQNVEVVLGTPVDHILAEHGYQSANSSHLIIGGPMMGHAMEQSQIPVIKTTNCILAPSPQEMPEQAPAQACIRCGMCAEACPASLLPQQLYWYAQAEDFDKLNDHNLFDCIECGACSYVCPSNIPLVQYYRASKGAIRQADNEKLKSDRSRERFEFRQTRLAKVEAEKEERRQARKRAAEEAKKKQAEKAAKAAENPETATEAASPEKAATDTNKEKTTVNNNDLVMAAMAKANNAEVDPAKEKAKRERALSGAESSLERVLRQLQEAKDISDDARAETLQARIKQVELKVKEAKEKLEAL